MLFSLGNSNTTMALQSIYNINHINWNSFSSASFSGLSGLCCYSIKSLSQREKRVINLLLLLRLLFTLHTQTTRRRRKVSSIDCDEIAEYKFFVRACVDFVYIFSIVDVNQTTLNWSDIENHFIYTISRIHTHRHTQPHTRSWYFMLRLGG